jgi:uncharacterized protein (TIGR02452 family)
MRKQRQMAAQIATGTLSILEAGGYFSPSREWRYLDREVQQAVKGTVLYPPEVNPQALIECLYDTHIEVCNESTLAAAHRLVRLGQNPVALNFASAKNPGGGFLSGARAQEESIARASALYPCLKGKPMYGYHRRLRDFLYTDYAIYSPFVPVFRDDDDTLLEEPYLASIITAPAVNAGALERSRQDEVLPAMQRRIDKVLHIGIEHGHASIVLGAWGCGVFKNDPIAIARLFKEALQGRFRRAYQTVVFAVLNTSRKRDTLQAFENEFHVGSKYSTRL